MQINCSKLESVDAILNSAINIFHTASPPPHRSGGQSTLFIQFYFDKLLIKINAIRPCV